MPDTSTPRPSAMNASLPRWPISARMFDVSSSIIRASLQGHEIKTIFHDAARNVAEVLRCAGVSIQEYMPASGTLAYYSGSGWERFPADEAITREAQPSAGVYCMLHGTSFNAAVNEQVRGAYKLSLGQDVTGVLAVIIPGGNHPFGVLSAYHTTGYFSDEDQAWIQSIADLLGLVAQQHTTAHALRQERDQLLKRNADLAAGVTAGQQTYGAVSNSENRLQKLIENLTEGLMIFDEGGVHFNFKPECMAEQMRQSMGRLPDMQGFIDAFDIYNEEGQRLPHEHWPHVSILAGKPLRNLDLKIRQHHTGWQRDFRYNGGAFNDASGKTIHYMTISDVTAQKAAERLLRLNEAKFRALIENSKDIFIISNPTQLHFISENVFQILGYTPEEYLKLPLDHVVHPDDQPMRWNELATPGDAIDLSFRSLHKDGTWRWMEGKGLNLSDIENIQGYLFTIRDVTDRRLAEQKIRDSEKIHRAIASSIPGSVICLLDREYRYVLIEGDLMERLGYDRNMLLGRKAADVLVTDTFERLQQNLVPAFEGKNISEEQNRNGIDLMIRYIPLQAHPGDPIDLVMIAAFDVTRIKEAQRTMIRINEELEQKVSQRTKALTEKNQELNAFNYSVAHDLRAPLRAINGYAQILIDDFAGGLDYDGKRICNIIALQSRRMGQLIDDLLALSRLNRVHPVLHELNMTALVWDVYQQITTDEDRSRIDFRADSLHRMAGDSTLMRQLWQNLIGNAVKFSHKKPRALISIESTLADGQITYVIRDNGAGFDAQYAGQLFGIFERLHHQSEYEGTGVGLAIVARIVQLHGGTIRADGAADKGAAFFVTYPSVHTTTDLHVSDCI